ncbi:heterogeneous nuclear ribonucleoprotein 27C isoform X1 [Folsomia candida]|uniref:heterogeneous nuclear ribonucleoprotein 27C isoform X1 n=1 Tax=Folsomia candida TaxID=158441 RepID=UPI000B907791|nr:heterogeneous nuclear ribonucleoprotein 27C isoform X1 [Folsomia candida]
MKKDGEGDERGNDFYKDQDDWKLFIGGLSWETTIDGLQRYFSRFGEVVDAVVMKNPDTGRSRGFGFVTFSDPANVDAVLNSGPHQLDGRTIDPKPCNPRTMQKPKRGSNVPKVFLGGLPPNVTETDLRSFFDRYGKVVEVVIMYDQERRRTRGFGFVSFESDDPVERLVAEHFVNVNGKQVEIKRAEPRDGRGGVMGRQSGWGTMMGNPMGHMPPGGMMQGYQGWGTPPQQSGYAPQGYQPGGGQSYQGWGQATQGQQMPQWGSYGATPQQSYGGYGTTPQNSYGANWNYTMGQNGQSSGATPQATDMYGRQGATPSAAPGTAPGAAPAPQKAASSYPYSTPQPQYGTSAGYSQQPQDTAAGAYGPSRAYAGTGAASGYGSTDATGAGNYGPQRGGSYSQPSQSSSYHPYRR